MPQTGLEPVTQEFSVLCSTIGATVALFLAGPAGIEPTSPSSKHGILSFELKTLIGGSGEIRTHGAFRHDSFQDCCLKPDSATLPIMLVYLRCGL